MILLLVFVLDLGFPGRRGRFLASAEALGWVWLWTLLTLTFAALLYPAYENEWWGLGSHYMAVSSGKQALLEFVTGFVVQRSLTFHQVLLIALIVTYFQVPLRYQPRLLFWGLLAAIIMRIGMVLLGISLMEFPAWLTYSLGGLLFFSAAKLLFTPQSRLVRRKGWVVSSIRRFYPTQREFEGAKFVVARDEQLVVTPLLLALASVISLNFLYAVNAVPAGMAVTEDPFLMLSSNLFALLGMRAIYFATHAIFGRLWFLKTSLALLLTFVGIKLILLPHEGILVGTTLAILLGILGMGVVASFLGAPKDTADLFSPIAQELPKVAVMTYRKARRLVILIVGASVILFGVVLLVMPGPGLLVIFFGLAILATEFVWARRWLKKYSKGMEDVAKRAWRLWRRQGGTSQTSDSVAKDSKDETGNTR